jgi:hypothetical protein
VTPTVEFHETLVQLLIGALFVMIAASVSPSEVKSVLGGALALVAVMVLVIRPAIVALTTWRSRLCIRERAFVAWMAPRGIVAGATASAFGLQLASAGVHGANKILPIVFVAIFGTVVIYGLTGTLVARRLGVAGANGTLVLIVGGHELARAIGSALKRAGVGVRLWAGPSTQAAAREAGLEADSGRMLIDSLSREAELEEITDALVLSRSDDFNALAAKELRQDLGHGHVYRIAPEPSEPDLLQPSTNVDVLGRNDLTSAELTRRLAQGERFIRVTIDGIAAPIGSQDGTTLFVVATDGSMRAVTGGNAANVRNGDSVIKLVADPPNLP